MLEKLDTSQPEPFIEVEDARKYLSKKDSLIKQDDTDKLTWMVDAACLSIVNRVGEVSPVEMRETIQFTGGIGVPMKKPIISVETSGFNLNDPAGAISGVDSGLHVVEYTAGRDPIPERYLTAAREMVLHIWRSSQHNNSQGRATGSDQPMYPQTEWILPIRVRELLGLSKMFTNKPFVGRPFL